MNGMLIGRVRGVPIRLNWSVVVIAALITWSLADAVLPELVEGESTEAYWLAGAVTSALFLASLAAHELSHAVVAIRENVSVRAITLWLFGGVAELGSKPETPGAAFRIAAAGPAMSGAIGVAALAVGALTTGLTQAAVVWLGLMNLFLMAFNLLPAFPLDGGRIYHAWLWNKGGDEMSATTRAVDIGQRVGAVLVGLGVVQVVFGALVGGIWMMAIGWFLREAARAEWRGTVLERPLATLTVSEVMSADPVTTSGTTDIDTFISDLFHGGRHAAYPVCDAEGAVTGLITIADVRSALPRGVDGVTVDDLAVPLGNVTLTTTDTPVGELLRDMTGKPEGRALVFDGDELVGIVAPSDIARLVEAVEVAALHHA